MIKFFILIFIILSCSSDPITKRAVVTISNVQMPFIWIPSGSFKMGSNDLMAQKDEQPVHKIFLNGFGCPKHQ